MGRAGGGTFEGFPRDASVSVVEDALFAAARRADHRDGLVELVGALACLAGEPPESLGPDVVVTIEGDEAGQSCSVRIASRQGPGQPAAFLSFCVPLALARIEDACARVFLSLRDVVLLPNDGGGLAIQRRASEPEPFAPSSDATRRLKRPTPR